MSSSKFKTKIIIIIITGIVLLSLVSFGYFYVSNTQNDKDYLAGGCFNTSFTDGESINLQNAFPQSFDEAKENKTYDFTLTNTCNLSVKYYILLNVKDGSFDSSFIDYTLNTKDYSKLSETIKNTKYNIGDGYTDSYIIGSGFLKESESITEKLRLWIDENISQNDLAANSKFTAQIKIVTEVGDSAAVNTLNKLQTLNPDLKISNHKPDFSKIAPETENDNETGIYTMEDDYGQSIYFRGDIKNNYVKFGKNSNGNDMYWRIVRINGNGSVRMIYDGTEAYANGTRSSNRTIGTAVFQSGNMIDYDAGYVGYMYGSFPAPASCTAVGADSSNLNYYTCSNGGSTSYEQAHDNIKSSKVKSYTDSWYKLNIVDTNYDKYISDEIFCNDRTIVSGLGYGQNETTFAGFNRAQNENPSLICDRKDDKFTKFSSIGNQKLTYPVGLITGDELMLAGNKYLVENSKSYLFKGVLYVTMTPAGKNETHWGTTRFYMFYLRNSGTLGGQRLAKGASYVAPVINIKSEYVDKFSGTGEINNPFYVDET